ncbi:MAG: isopeptide-forming domain-containing fimbrial protein [Clostridia bacterium]|nr:isopeptide-forming domain-containing fimbrial protein [Clostridia bacterium]
MKRANKYLSLALALIMALSLCVTSFAADISVEGAVNSETYKAYKIFDYTKNGENFAYTIEANSPWKTFLDGYKYNNVDVFTFTASATDATKLVVTVDKSFTGDAAAADLAAKLMENVGTIEPTQVVVANGTTALFTDLPLGYYFVDTSLGSLCSLVNIDTTQKLLEKNEMPTVQKFVQEDNGEAWGKVATADFNQVVKFKLTTKVTEGNDQDYIFTDKIPAGMTYSNVKVAIGGKDFTDFTLNKVGDNDFQLIIPGTKIATFAKDTAIEITYDAKVETTAVVEGDGNLNMVELNYSDHTTTDSATVYTLDFDVYKYFETKQGETTAQAALANAKFVLMNANNEYAVAELGENDVYTFTKWGTSAEATKFASPTDGEFKIQGLDADTYTLEEVEAPAGYNLLTSKITVVLGLEVKEGTETYSLLNGETSVERIEVLNQSGAMLPGTGGVGTTMFYVLGSVMMIGAAVLLVTKKKMANEQ